MPGSEEVCESFLEVSARLLGDIQGRSDRLGDQNRVGERGQLHEPYAIGVLLQQGSTKLERKPRFSNATCTGERYNVRAGEQPLHVRDLPFSSDETGELPGEVVGKDVKRLEERELGPGAQLGRDARVPSSP